MKREILRTYLDPALARLKSVYEEVARTQGFSEDTEKLLILIELLKEQSPNENIDHSNCETR